MQKYVTPLPGRTPLKGNIVNREDYKLDLRLKEFRQGEHALTIETYIPEHGWVAKYLFINDDELKRIQEIINGSSVS
jgi:hypothetical protein